MDDDVVLGEYILPSRSSHFRNLMPAIDELLARVNIELSMLGSLIVAIGPGSFTGIRIGLSVVKIERIETNKMYFTEVDVLDQTPVLDIKPYVKYFDSRDNVVCGWLDKHFESGDEPGKLF